jgi:integrase/recombinase XerD
VTKLISRIESREELIMAELSPARVTGPLAPYAEGFRASLLRVGYTERTARDGVYVLAHLSRWLCEEDLETSELRSEELERFLAARRTTAYRRGRSAQSLRPLLGYLREIQVVPPAEPSVASSPLEKLLDDYGRYLRIERRLAPTTVRTNEDVARRFLSARARSEDLPPFDVTASVVCESRRYSTGSIKVLTAALRSMGVSLLSNRAVRKPSSRYAKRLTISSPDTRGQEPGLLCS